MTQARDLRDALRRCLADSPQARGFDEAVRTHVARTSLDWKALAPIVEELVRGVQEELEADERCKERKHAHRAWIRGFVMACAEGGLRGEKALVPLAHLTLLTCYDEGIMLRVFASSLGYGAGQAWAEISRDDAERKAWLAALQAGVLEGLKTLAEDVPELDPELMAPEGRILGALERGMGLGAFVTNWTPKWR
ncbi:hypothetical protein D3C86_470670 [compost metagenome]